MPADPIAFPTAIVPGSIHTRTVTTALRSAASIIFEKWDEAQRAHQQVCRERLELIAQRHRELLEVIGYYEGLQAAYEHLRRMSPLDEVTSPA
jgi:hypothetical protein